MFWIVVVAAVAFLLYPFPEKAKKQESSAPPLLLAGLPTVAAKPSAPKHCTYLESMSALATVRERLIATDKLTDEAQAASNVLTLALASASEK